MYPGLANILRIQLLGETNEPLPNFQRFGYSVFSREISFEIYNKVD
jgi:hypothetical protein